ncbi:DUF4350 domain-containing protein [Halorubrum tebenquichense]|uniref:Nuclease n=1 Tax=Halorubrum tebenquichense DSM 14210 TaxID=1227485 RepID=M0E638_9EURY|nr:DUF4350 domain-containing protein [Halorubrum tebenquichense]ELZ41824.1 nuclease [Halorubrum tebenquichense DSM 14210]
MRRRSVLIGLGATAAGGGAIATGAFDTATAERDATVALADDASSLLSLTPLDEEFAFVDDDGELALVFEEVEGGGTGFGSNTVYEIDEVFQVSNQGTEDLGLFATVDDGNLGDASFDLTVDGETLGEDPTVDLGVGEVVAVGVAVDAGDDPTDGEVAITIGIGDGPTEDPGDGPGEAPTEFVDELVFDSTASLLAEDGSLPEEAIAVAAESTAASTDADGDGDDTNYPDDAPLPLVAVDQDLPVVAFGFPFAQNDVQFVDYGNEEVLLNLLDEYADSDTVLWDEGHDQFYGLDSHSAFADYAGENGYTLESTTDLESDLLGPASAIVITSPSAAFSDDEIGALSSFADAGGLIVLMDQSDYSDFDETGNLNALATGLETQIRFNDNQVIDGESNAGSEFAPTTTDLDTGNYPELFADRDGLGLELDPNEEYEVEIASVADGDTADVAFDDGTEETVRILGIDTPETGETEERLEEYEGIDDAPALKDEGDEATDYAESELEVGSTVTLSFDENEGLRGNFGRLLGFLELPDGSVYNANVIEAGWARVYDSGLGEHDEYWDLERAARDAGDGIWGISDQAGTDERRDDPVDELFFPEPVAVSGPEEPVASEGGETLVALDPDANVAALGGPLIEESFEGGEGGPGVEAYGVFPFLTNVIDRVGDATGPVLVDGGHGQFAADFAVSAEDAAYYLRYLEGQAPGDEAFVDLEGVVDLATDPGPDLLDSDGNPAARALILSTPTEALSSAERTVVADFADAGGAVVLLGTAADADALGNFDPVVNELDADVTFTGAPVTDAENNLGDPANPTTTNFADGFDGLFTPFTADDGGDGGSGGSLSVVEVNADTEGDDLEDPQENVVFENAGGDALDLTGYTVSDETTKEYSFPDGFSLSSGEQVTLYSGEGTDTDAELYWQSGAKIWNNGGDTVSVTDSDGNVVVEYEY